MSNTLNMRKKQLAMVVSAASALIASVAPIAASAQDAEEIVITGSRIVRRDLSAPSPIVTVGSDSFENTASVSAEQVLNQLPQFVPGGTQFVSGIQSGPTASPGAATLNLRGMGSNRNLVLIDGKRAQPANASLAVDINTIPSSAIANVEVISGGASAVYGPDAMAGVVNFILKDNFEGIEFDFQTGVTAEGDGEEQRFSTLLGMNSADNRGNIMIGLDWTKRAGIYQKDRDFYVNGWNDPSNPGGGFINPGSYGAGQTPGNAPSQDAVDTMWAQYIPGYQPGDISNTADVNFNVDGTPFTASGPGAALYNGALNCWDLAACGRTTGIKRLANGDLDLTFTEGFLSTPMERHSLFLRGHYDVTDTISAFAQANFSQIEVGTNGGIPPAITVWQAPIPRDGRDLPADLNDLLDSRADPTADWSLYQVLNYNGPIVPENTSNVWQIMLGLEGELFDGDWTWEAYASRGDTSISKVNNGMPSLQRYQSLVASGDFGVAGVNAGRGYAIRCASGLPVFDDFTPDQSCLDGIDSKMVDSSHLTQEILEANIQGGLFELPAGQVRFAAGMTYRGNSFDYQPGNPAGAVVDNPVGLFASNATGGKINVREVYGEALVPVIEGLDLELGYRYSDFSTAGGQDTYKALFTWQATDEVTFRGGYQFATRAPNIAELFTAPTQVVVFFPGQEPCSATTQATWGNVASNPDRAQVIDLCRAIIGNNTSDFDTQTYSVLGVNGPEGWHRRTPPYFPLAIEERAGNPNVGPEQGETITFGAVVSEPFGLENLTLTADYYQIELTDAIAPLSVATIYDNCFNRFGTNPNYDVNNEFCQLITRNPISGDRQQVAALFSNLGIIETSGLDVTANWSTDIGPGSFNVNTTMSFLENYEYQTAPGQSILDAKGTMDQGGLYDWQAFTRFGYMWDNVTLGLSWKHLSSIEDADYARNPSTALLGTGSYDLFNFNGSYNWENYTIRFGINNLFDEEPNNIGGVDPNGDSNSNSTSPGNYDPIGRTYYVGIKASF